jgi:hypothetical protein
MVNVCRAHRKPPGKRPLLHIAKLVRVQIRPRHAEDVAHLRDGQALGHPKGYGPSDVKGHVL